MILKELIKLGAKRLIQLAALLFLLWGLNGSLLLLDLWFMFHNKLTLSGTFPFLLALVWGALWSLYSLWRIYGVVSLEIFKLLYDELAPLRKKMSKEILMSIKGKVSSETQMKGMRLDEHLDGFPWVFRFPIQLILRQIPIFKVVKIAKEALLENNKEYACAQFDKALDELIQEIYLDAARLSWIYWVIPVMVLGHLGLGCLIYLS